MQVYIDCNSIFVQILIISLYQAIFFLLTLNVTARIQNILIVNPNHRLFFVPEFLQQDSEVLLFTWVETIVHWDLVHEVYELVGHAGVEGAVLHVDAPVRFVRTDVPGHLGQLISPTLQELLSLAVIASFTTFADKQAVRGAGGDH